MAIIELDLTYAGRRQTRRGPLAYFYEDPASPGELRGFQKPLITGLKVGAIVRIKQEDDGSYYARGEHAPQTIGHVQDAVKLRTWSLDQEADVALHAQQAESKKIAAAGVDPMRAILAPIRENLATMSSTRRAATIGWIISYLQSGTVR